MRRAGLRVAIGVWLMLTLGPLASVAQASKIEPGKGATLAFTGIDVRLLLLIGAVLLCAGIVLRRFTRRAAGA